MIRHATCQGQKHGADAGAVSDENDGSEESHQRKEEQNDRRNLQPIHGCGSQPFEGRMALIQCQAMALSEHQSD